MVFYYDDPPVNPIPVIVFPRPVIVHPIIPRRPIYGPFCVPPYCLP